MFRVRGRPAFDMSRNHFAIVGQHNSVQRCGVALRHEILDALVYFALYSGQGTTSQSDAMAALRLVGRAWRHCACIVLPGLVVLFRSPVSTDFLCLADDLDPSFRVPDERSAAY